MQCRDKGYFPDGEILDPFRFLLIALSGWMNQQQLQLIDYLEKRTECFANNSAKSDDGSTMTSAAERAKGLGNKLLRDLGTIVMPATLLAWHRGTFSSL